MTLRQPALKEAPFVFAAPDHGRMIITAANSLVKAQGIEPGMTVADAKAFVPSLQVFDERPELAGKLLKALGEWCIRYTPVVAVDLPDGLILDISGCTHLWGGERAYLKEIVTRLRSKGYDVRAAIADTIGTAWGVARFGKVTPLIEPGRHAEALFSLPSAALRLDPVILERLHKLGLYSVGGFIHMPRSVLRRRFGEGLLTRIRQALGDEDEPVELIRPINPYEERLPCLEPIRTITGIEIAVKKLLEGLCSRLKKEGKGVRKAILKCYRLDGKVEQVDIGTNRPSHHIQHLCKLFELKLSSIEPDLGIELFIMEALKVEDAIVLQETLWAKSPGLDNVCIAELLDRLAGKIGANAIHRYLPVEHHWPEKSIKQATSVQEKPSAAWRRDIHRPVQLLAQPEQVQVMVKIPDYPPKQFIYKGKRHEIIKADGPERIEREWWMENGEHRDYYRVEDHEGKRYWLFRSGHYSGDQSRQWYLHGFFA